MTCVSLEQHVRGQVTMEASVFADRRLSDAQQAALIAVYDSMLRD